MKRFPGRPLATVLAFALATASHAAEPFLVADLGIAGAGSLPVSFVELDGLVYFIAEDVAHGRELWVSDGTAAGTRRITDLDPGSGSSLTFELVTFADRLFFPASAGGEAAGLYSSDGSASGTGPVGGVQQSGLGVRELTVAGDRLFYVASLGGAERLWISDGTTTSTFPIAPVPLSSIGVATPSNPRRLTPTGAGGPGAGPVLFLDAQLEGVGRTLWATDGTSPGTVALPQVRNPTDIVALPDGRVVTAVDTLPNAEDWGLWVSDGSEEGTEIILEVTSVGGPFIDLLAVAGGRLFFTISDGSGGFELWVTDGSPAGTHFVTELLSEELQEVPRLPAFAPLGDRLLFQGFDPATGHELWFSDGTAAGTGVYADVVPGSDSSEPLTLTPGDDLVFFTATEPDDGRELWAIAVAEPTAVDPPTAVRLTSAGGPQGGSPGALTLLGEELWFSLIDANGREPWTTDGTPAGTSLLAVLNPQATASSTPFPVGTVGPLLFFARVDDPEIRLWRSDGSVSGTVPLGGPAGPARLTAPFEPTFAHGGFLYFNGPPASGSGEELWRSDGETAAPITDLEADGVGPAGAVGDRILFTALVGAQLGLYRFDGAAVDLMADLDTAASTRNSHLLSGASRAFILVLGGAGVTLWSSDGTTTGTRLVANLDAEVLFDRTHVFGDRLFFAASTPETGFELWTSDGTSAGTRLVADLLPGELSSNPRGFAALDGWLYFLASGPGGNFDDNANIWRADPASTVVERVHDRCVEHLTPAAWELYFVPCSRRDTLWTLDGEPPVAREVAELEPPIPVTFPLLRVEPHTSSGSLLYFLLEDAEAPGSQPGVFVSDGTEEGTRVFTAADGSLARPNWVHTAGGLVFFDSDDGIHGRELWAAPLECFASERTLCLGDDRFQARARWRDFIGKAGGAPTVPVSNESGGFWFFDEQNPELFLKTLDGRAINDRFWVFFGSLSNVELDVAVVDTATGAERIYRNPSGRFASFGDTAAFDGETAGTTIVVPPSAELPEVSSSSGATGPCVADAVTQCQLDRFRVEVEWTDFDSQSGPGRVRGLSGDLEGFWFFDPDNVEMAVKVLDGRPINGRYWVFFGSLTDVAFELTVTDTATGAQRTYSNPPSNFASFGDVVGFLP